LANNSTESAEESELEEEVLAICDGIPYIMASEDDETIISETKIETTLAVDY
jgi:hypothetical protein